MATRVKPNWSKIETLLDHMATRSDEFYNAVSCYNAEQDHARPNCGTEGTCEQCMARAIKRELRPLLSDCRALVQIIDQFGQEV